MRSKEKIREFLNAEHVGRISTIDPDGFPQTIPMNFVYLNGAVYMHSHVRGEKTGQHIQERQGRIRGGPGAGVSSVIL